MEWQNLQQDKVAKREKERDEGRGEREVGGGGGGERGGGG